MVTMIILSTIQQRNDVMNIGKEKGKKMRNDACLA